MEGRGVWVNAQKNEMYEGEFVANKRHGKGTLTKNKPLSEGNAGVFIYSGDFLNHKFNGQGTFTSENEFGKLDLNVYYHN